MEVQRGKASPPSYLREDIGAFQPRKIQTLPPRLELANEFHPFSVTSPYAIGSKVYALQSTSIRLQRLELREQS